MERGAASGILIALLQYADGQASPRDAAVIPLVWIFAGSLVALSIHGLGKAFAIFGDIGRGLGGFISLIGLLFIAIGDPILWLISKIDPILVPVERFSIFNRAPVMIAYQSAPA